MASNQLALDLKNLGLYLGNHYADESKVAINITWPNVF